ncbi:MAG: hypothetical protein ACRD2W_21235, partial [Acidimicrobiales bacterium]
VLVGAIAALDRSPEGAAPAAAPSDVALTVAPPTNAPTTAVADPSTCRNSYNASCGPFRWDPEPPEVPIDVQVTVEPASPRVGEAVAFMVTTRSAAGRVRQVSVATGDGGSPRADTGRSCAMPGSPTRYGPWDLPAPVPDEYTSRYPWTYQAAGTYTARFAYDQWTCGRGPQYPGRGEASVTVTVRP